MSNSEKKDWWDKADIVLRAFVPVAVGLMLLAWNNQRTTQQTSAAMTEIAVGVLSEEPEGDVDPLRTWAISVLRNPSEPPNLSAEAAAQLENENLSLAWSKIFTPEEVVLMNDAFLKLQKIDVNEADNSTPEEPQ